MVESGDNGALGPRESLGTRGGAGEAQKRAGIEDFGRYERCRQRRASTNSGSWLLGGETMKFGEDCVEGGGAGEAWRVCGEFRKNVGFGSAVRRIVRLKWRGGSSQGVRRPG
jgi:hypothetical protein